MEMQGSFYMRYAQNIKGFYPHVPEYAGNATNFSCGHFAVHYACNVMKQPKSTSMDLTLSLKWI